MDQYKERWSLDVDNVKSCWRAELEVGNRKRVHHLKQLKSVLQIELMAYAMSPVSDLLHSHRCRPILPPATTKVSCQAWYQALSSLTDDLNSLHNRYLTQLQSTQETIASTCLLEVDRCKVCVINLEVSLIVPLAGSPIRCIDILTSSLLSIMSVHILSRAINSPGVIPHFHFHVRAHRVSSKRLKVVSSRVLPIRNVQSITVF